MRTASLLIPIGFTLILVGCGNMDRATLQDKIQADANRQAGRIVVASVHCRSDQTMPDETDMCIVVPANGSNPIGLLIPVHGNSYRILQPPSQLR
jgi:hypothetical protein